MLFNVMLLKQVIKKPTRNLAILDLILTDIHKFYQAPLVLAPIGTSDHCTIIWSSQEQMKHKQKSKRINVRPYISKYNWSPVLNASCINDKVSTFLEITTEMVDAFFPLKSVKIQVDDKPFINGRIKQLIQKRDKAYQLGRVDQSKLLRNLIVAEIRKAKRVFYQQNIIPFHNQNSKKWWENVKRIVGNKRQNFDLSDPLSDASMNDKQTADYINSFFTSLTKEYPKVKAHSFSFR